MGIDDKKRATIKEIPYSLPFFEIQSAFAKRVSEIKGIPTDEALLKYTTFYKRIGIDDWKHDPSSDKWQEFIAGVKEGQNPAELAHSIYIKRVGNREHLSEPKSCFSYSYDRDDKAIEIHFQNNFSSDGSPLSKENIPVRMDELKTIFQEVREKHPEAKIVQGGSWLYSYDSYKRLFPPEYIQNLHEPPRGGLKGNGRWGQFLMSSGNLNVERTQQFFEAVSKAKTEDELFNSFPLKLYDTEAPIGTFYKHLGIEDK